jgi:ubiquinone/menaquinone biosynthesis C-methylase UbiE
MDDAEVRATRRAYDAAADRYAELLRSELDGLPLERALLGAFVEVARSNSAGPIADVGCGPGRIAAYLTSLGAAVQGIDLSPGMIRAARRDHPLLCFEMGSMEELPFDDGSMAGVLAWYSIIHVPPARLAGVLEEFRRVLVPGAPLLLSFQAGTGKREVVNAYGSGANLDAYRVSPEAVVRMLPEVGFEPDSLTQREPQGRERTPQAFLQARKAQPVRAAAPPE